MHILKKQIPAFTLIEIIISMVIMSFLVLASYALLQKSGLFVVREQTRVHSLLESTQFYSTMVYDISRAAHVEQTQHNRITIKNEIRADIEYLFYPEMLIRTQEQHVDTFFSVIDTYPEFYDKYFTFSIQLEQEVVEVMLAKPYTYGEYCNSFYLE